MNKIENIVLGNESIPYWLNLKECCKYKGINYKTVNNKAHLKPDPKRAKKIGGRICWDRDYIFSDWLFKTDEEIENE